MFIHSRVNIFSGVMLSRHGRLIIRGLQPANSGNVHCKSGCAGTDLCVHCNTARTTRFLFRQSWCSWHVEKHQQQAIQPL